MHFYSKSTNNIGNGIKHELTSEKPTDNLIGIGKIGSCEFLIPNRIFDRWHDGPLRTKDKKGNCLIKLSLFTIKRFDVTEIRTIKIPYSNTV